MTSYISVITITHHSSNGRQPTYAACNKQWNYGTSASRHFQQTAPPTFRGRPSRCPHSSLSFFLAYSQPSQIGCLPYFDTWCDLSANLECRSEMRHTLLENTRRKNSPPKIRHLRTIAQICRAISSQLRYVSTIGKTLLTRKWANAQLDGRPAEYRWRPLYNAAKFGWRPLLDAVQ